MADCVSLIQKNLESIRYDQENIANIRNEGTIIDLIKSTHGIYVNFNLKAQERENANAYLLNPETGILSSLKAFLAYKDFRPVQLECFRLLDDIIELSPQNIQDYGYDIQSVCVMYISRETSADVKKASIITLSKILEACQGFQGDKKIQPKPLIDSLFFQLSRGSKLSTKVKEEILCLIGVIAHFYPEDFIPYHQRVLLMFIQELKTEVNSKSKDTNLSVVAGCLQGLKELLYNFPVLCNEETEKSYLIFSISRTMATNLDNFNTKTSSAIRAGLQMISAHGMQFSTFIFDCCIDLYTSLIKWMKQGNRDMQKLGRDAVVSVLKVVSEMIMTRFDSDADYCRKIFKFFVESFRDFFLSSDNSHELHLAVIGYGLFARPCKLCVKEDMVKVMLHNIIQKSEYEFFSENEDISDKILDLPSYIESIASIISNTEFIPENTLFAIQKLVIFQIDKFPKVPTKYNFLVPKAIIYILVSLQPKKELFMDFLSEIVYQGLMKTCCHPVAVEAENLKDKISDKGENEYSVNPFAKESTVKIVTCKDYLYLWKNLLNVVQLKELSSLGISLQDRQYLMECIYDQLIRSSLDMISKLDLTLEEQTKKDVEDVSDGEDEADISSDPFHGNHPNNITDYYIFLNLVDFLSDLLTERCTNLFTKWVYIFGREMVSYVSLHPLHSGFYKLIAMNLSICDKIEYFKDSVLCEKTPTFNCYENEIRASFQLFSKFVKEVFFRLQQYKDELLASCLQVILVLPIEIVLQEIDTLIPALETALKLGNSYLPLASKAISALEKWSDCVPLDKLQAHFPRLLPHLNSYILASSFSDAHSIPAVNQTKAPKTVHKMSTKSVRKHRNTNSVIDDPELQKIQLRIIKFLGRLGKSNSALLQNSFENMDKVAIAWDSLHRHHLKYAIPFVDMKPEIYFDDFLPRILEVASKSSVIQVKVAACEALHSLVLYMIGRGSQMPEDLKKKYSMESLYKNIFPGLLELACDIEQVAKQLFRPLIFQLIHWFTHSKVIRTAESYVILQALWDGVTHKENTSLRDFSAICLKEYFQWFLKQAPEGKEKLIASLLNKLTSFSLHPSPYKRMGAALTFNNIYKIFRNEEELVKTYTIQLLVQFVDSLAIAHNDDKSSGTQKQCLIALDHVEKIVIKKHKYFLKPPHNAKVPRCLEDVSLKSVVQWLLYQCGCIQTECRHKCMDLVIKLFPLIPDLKDPASFLMNYNVDGKNIFEDIFERALRNKSDFKDLLSYKAVTFWLEALLTSLECYHWAFSDGLLLQTVLDGEKHADLLSSVKIFNVIKYFITNIAKETLSVVTRTSDVSPFSVYSPAEENKYNKLKCSVIVRLMSFIVSVTKKNAKWFHDKFFEILWCSDLWEVLMFCIVHPSHIGFDMNDPEIFTNLPKETSFLLENCLSKQKEFQEYCCIFLDSPNYCLPKKLPLTFRNIKEDPLRLIQIFIGYEKLILYKLWSPSDSTYTTENELICDLLKSVAAVSSNRDDSTNQQVTSNPVVLSVAEKMLSLTFALGLKEEDLAVILLNRKELLESHNLSKCEGLVFSNFTKIVCEFVARNPKSFIKIIIDNLNPKSFTEVSILLKFIDCVARTKFLRRNYGKQVIDGFLLNWDKICALSMYHPDSESMYSVLSLMLKMLLIDSEVAFNSSGSYCTSLYDTYLILLKKEGVTLDFIVKAFEILPFFLSSEKSDLRECLEQIIATHFPLQSTELKRGSASYHTYVSALKKLLTALHLTGCECLLEILTLMVCKESSHLIEDDFKKSIILMVKRTEQSEQDKFANYIFQMVMNDKCSLKSDVLLDILEKVLVFLLQKCGISSFINFFKVHLKEIVGMSKGNPSSATEDNKIVRKIYGLRLLELLYETLPKDLVHSKDSEIVATYLDSKPKNGNELSSDIMKCCLEFKATSYEKKLTYTDLHRKLNCACFNTLIAIISCTQSEIKFYNVFLFKENPVKNELIWERIIDKQKALKFDMELDAPLLRQKKFISIRHHMRSTTEENDSQVDNSQIESSLQLLGSENLGLSSLAEDASKFVFTTDEQVFTSEKNELIAENKVDKFGYIKKQERFEDVIELEDDELNKHECMVPLSCLIKHMKLIGLIPDEPTEDSAPNWINFLAESLGDTNHINIKLFIGRLIVNNAKILQPYGKFLLKPMIKLIASGAAGIELNYYILDVIITLLSWAPTHVPGENLAYETCELLKFLIRNCDHTRREIFRNNMEVVKTILECWKDVLEIPYEDLYQKMNDPDTNSKKNVFGIQLLGIVLMCNFPPFDLQEEAKGLRYLHVLLKNLNYKYKEVYGCASEVTSLVLKYFVEKEGNIEKNAFFLKVVNHLDNLKNQGDEGKFLYCLNKIHLGCPQVADKFLSKLLFIYPSIHAVYKNHILEVLCSRVDAIPNVFKELKSIGIFENMEKKSEFAQHLSLQALEKLIPSLTCDDILNILPDIVEIHTQPSVKCRLALFKILFVLFETYMNNAGAKEKEILRYAQETLIAGLADPDEFVRLTINNFWSNEKRLPSGTKERLIALLKNLYSPTTEECFLQYATFLLLERTSNSPDYKRKVFEHPLTECNFQAYQIQVSWRKRHVAMAPVFTETVSSSLNSSFMTGESFGAGGEFVKATQIDYDFSETLDPSKVVKTGTYNWLTEKSMDTFAFQGPSAESFLGSFSGSVGKSHLIALKSNVKSPVKDNKSAPEIKKKEDKKQDRSSVWMLKRRFMKDKGGSSDSFAKQELRRQDRRMEMLKEQQSRRESHFEMYRKYRIGELPDIEISNSAIIAPVQALAMNDVVVARLLFKSLVTAVCDYVKEDCPEEYDSLLSEISSSFGNILSRSYIRSPPVISFCLESLNQLQDANFDAENVFVASIGSNQQSIGILLLESKILKGFDFQPNRKKKRNERQTISEERTFWMNLAELYRSLNDYDVVNGIFSHTMGNRKENRKALQLEASGHFFDAFELYNKLFDEASDEYDQAEKDFWDKSVLTCLDKLTKWENLETVVLERFTDPDSPELLNELGRFWEDQYMKDNYLPYFVRSKMKQLLDGKNDQLLLDFFDAAKKDEEKKRILFESFSEDLALLYILQDRFDIARQFSSNCLNKFLKDWQNLSPLAVGMQSFHLQTLLKYVDMDEFLYLMKKGNFLDVDSTVYTLKSWQKRYPSVTDPVNIWDDVCSNRLLYIRKLQEKLKSDESNKNKPSSQDSLDILETSTESKFDFKKLALETSSLMKLSFADTAGEQKNFAVALKKLKEIHKVAKSLDQNVWSRFILSYCSINNKRCSKSVDKLDILLQSWKQLDKLESKCGSNGSVKKLQSQTLELIGEMFINKEIKLSSLTSGQRETMLTLCGSSNQIVPTLLDKSFMCLKEVLHLKDMSETSLHIQNPVSAYMDLANFCNKYLRKEEDSGFSSGEMPSFQSFPAVLIQSLLTALSLGVADAFILFPRLLQIIELYPTCLPIFKEKVSKMPCWVFIGWISQMIALLDKPEASAVQEIIEKITLSYPDAIIYPFYLSYGSFKFSDTEEGETNKAFTEKIKSILDKQTLINDFVSALEQLSVPAVIFKDFYTDLAQLINSKAPKDDISSAFMAMYNNLFNLNLRDRKRRIPVGPMQQQFSKDYKDKVLKACGANGSKLCSAKLSEQQTALKNLQELVSKAIEEAKGHDPKVSKLEVFSPWLKDFQPWKYVTQIEIPGQYTGRSKPLPEYHVKVSGFDEKIIVLSSITLPRRITVRGNDEKEYKILVKAGEDLRQDARIQQMFSVMNEIYKNDIACAQRHLSLKTYKVIPLNNRLGLIEWVDNTTVLHSFLMDGMTDEEKEKNAVNAAKQKFWDWVKKFDKFDNLSSLYWTLYAKKSRKECVQKFQEITNMVPTNLLTKSFLKLSASPEAFVAIRTRFATSHAVICISQWILGIGDRHLNNFLVDKSSGYEIGIDFGHSFGSATQFLAVPELMPFRLTSQYLQLLDPLKIKGIYEATMVHALSALRNRYELLLNVLDIFIKEPTLDWKVSARKQQLEWGQTTTDDADWFPKQRITLARKKLEGVNPCYITRDELQLGHHSRDCFKNMESVCLGDKEHNVRATYNVTGLSPEEQVDCLIDQATDSHLLSLTYFGWSPWI